MKYDFLLDSVPSETKGGSTLRYLDPALSRSCSLCSLGIVTIRTNHTLTPFTFSGKAVCAL